MYNAVALKWESTATVSTYETWLSADIAHQLKFLYN
jgi:hypothetical protein